MKKVMIIDDDREFLDEIKETLSGNGYEVVVQSDARNAVIEVSRSKPDIVLLDLKMDVVSGFEIANELKRLEETSDIPIVGITGFYTEKEHRLLMEVCGMKKCLIKPINPDDMIEAIEESCK